MNQLSLNDTTTLAVILAGMRAEIQVPNPNAEGETMLVDAIPWQENEEGIVVLIQLPAYMHFATKPYQLVKEIIEIPGVPAPHNKAVRVWLKKPDESRIIRPDGATIPPNLRRLMNGKG